MSSASATPPARVEGLDKVTGRARYAYEHQPKGVAYAWVVQSRVARGRITAIGAQEALHHPGVIAVLWHANAPRLESTGDPVLAVLQAPDIAFHGQVVALVLADTAETAREAATTLDVGYEPQPHDVVLTPGHTGLYAPAGYDSGRGDPDRAFEASPVRIDATYLTPAQHNNPMEPHATTAVWSGDSLTVFDSNQGGHPVRNALATAFGLPRRSVRVISTHVGGGFGSKGTPRPAVVLAAMAAKVAGRPVKLTLTRQQMFSLVGYRSPTIQRLRLGADADGRLRSVSHDVTVQTATIKEFVEAAAAPTEVMYAAEHRRTSHLVTRLDVPVPSWMRAPGECPGMYALESAMDELALAVGIDPIELRVRNEPGVDPETGEPFSSRNLIACLRIGAQRFGWDGRDRRPRRHRDGRWWLGTGMAASTYPTQVSPASAAARADASGRFTVSINATDIGTGARTVLLQLAAESLEVPTELVEIRIGDTDLPRAGVAGGSMGTASWGWAVTKACRQLRERIDSSYDGVPRPGLEVSADTKEDIAAMEPYSRHAFGAQFVDVRVDGSTGEVRVPRMVGVFAAGRIVNARTARSQLIGGMTMGLSMALHEEGVMDVAFGDYANHDLASYHVAACADVGDIDVSWLAEDDPHLNGTGTKGIGEIGIVGTAAAIANAVHHATGVRVRKVPIHPEDLLTGL